MSYNFNDETPIYLQIIENIKLKIITGVFLPKEKLPSVRELSMEFEVNPNTVLKALVELENDGLIFTERTNGKFVTEDRLLIETLKNQMIEKKIGDFYDAMANIGIEKEEVLKILKERSDYENFRG